MSSDPQTLKVYGEKVADYVKVTEGAAKDPLLTAFIGGLARRARVLDLGCGPGFAAAEMARAGLQVEATDATPEMVALAAAHDGVNASLATFDEISGENLYDGIWANFCLLHAPRADMPRHLAALRKALKPGGLFHIGLKTGTGEHRDKLGRLYTYYTETELTGLLTAAGFTPFSSTTGCDKGLDGKMSDWAAIAAHG